MELECDKFKLQKSEIYEKQLSLKLTDSCSNEPS